MASGSIPDSSITASSFQKSETWNREPKYARFGSEKSWSNDWNDPEPWIQIDLGSSRWVTGLQTTGNNNQGDFQLWVEQITVKVGMTVENLVFIEDCDGQPKVSVKCLTGIETDIELLAAFMPCKIHVSFFTDLLY